MIVVIHDEVALLILKPEVLSTHNPLPRISPIISGTYIIYIIYTIYIRYVDAISWQTKPFVPHQTC